MLVVLPALLALSAFFSGGETALFSLTRHQRLQLSRAGTGSAVLVTRLVNARKELLVTLLMGNMFVNVLYFVIGTVLVLQLNEREAFGRAGPAVGTALNVGAVLVLILLGEVMPKLVASRFALRWSLITAVPLAGVFRALSPLRVILQVFLVEPISRLLAPRTTPEALSTLELEQVLALGEKRGVIDHEEERMLQQVLSLGQLKVRDLMTPRVEVRAFDVHRPAAELLKLARQRKYSRIPVYGRDLDDVRGIVYTRQVLLQRPSTRQDVEALIRRVHFVPEQQSASGLLVACRKRGMTLAMVVDEYGGTAGIITLEDVVEHMVGDIAGAEGGGGAPAVEPLGNNRWRVSASLSIAEWTDVSGRAYDVPGVATIGGLVVARLGRFPKVGDALTLGNLRIEVERIDRHRMDTLLLQLDPDTTAGS